MQSFHPENPLIVQGDQTILVEVASPRYGDARDALIRFAELLKAPEHVHTYRISPLSIWNACAAGMSVEEMLAALTEYAKYAVPPHVLHEVRDYASRYGRVKLLQGERGLTLAAGDAAIAEEIARGKHTAHLLHGRLSATEFEIAPHLRGELKQALIKIGYPAEDLAGYVEGEALRFDVREIARSGPRFALRDYQIEAANAFHAGGSASGGSGVVVLPCGAGKTIVGIACMARLQCSTLILTTSTTAVRQWISEVLDKTTLEPGDVAEYTGAAKEIRPVTIATYQIMTTRDRKDADFRQMALFDERNWGLIVYDEVHLLPAPVFRATASLQARRRLGLTATLVREDGREDDVFALIGPKKADVPWKVLEHQGWIATAACTEVRVPLPEELRLPYAIADPRDKHRLAAENPLKAGVVEEILEKHPGEQILIIGTYLDQLKSLAGGTGITVADRRYSAMGARQDLRRVSGGPHPRAGVLQDRQFRGRSAGRRGRNSDFGRLRVASGRGAAAGTHSAAEERKQSGAFLYRCHARYRGAGLRAEAAVVSVRARLRLFHRGSRRRETPRHRMRSLDVNWAEFIEALSAYRRLSVPAREQFIRNGPYSAPIRSDLLRESVREYQDAGLFSFTATGRTLVLAPAFRGLAKALRAMHRSRIDVKPGAESLDAYLADNFTREEWIALHGEDAYWHRSRNGLYPKIASVSWVEEFLRSGPRAFDAQRSLPLAPDPGGKSAQVANGKRSSVW